MISSRCLVNNPGISSLGSFYRAQLLGPFGKARRCGRRQTQGMNPGAGAESHHSQFRGLHGGSAARSSHPSRAVAFIRHLWRSGDRQAWVLPQANRKSAAWEDVWTTRAREDLTPCPTPNPTRRGSSATSRMLGFLAHAQESPCWAERRLLTGKPRRLLLKQIRGKASTRLGKPLHRLM